MFKAAENRIVRQTFTQRNWNWENDDEPSAAAVSGSDDDDVFLYDIFSTFILVDIRVEH